MKKLLIILKSLSNSGGKMKFLTNIYDRKLLNYLSIATIIAALGNIIIVLLATNENVYYFSAIFAWVVVCTTQLSLISVRLKK